MDFDEDDSLDDLLRDTSAAKTAKMSAAASNVSLNEPVEPPLIVNKKEKKSALLAQLFGPPASDLLDFPAESNNTPSAASRLFSGWDKASPETSLPLEIPAKIPPIAPTTEKEADLSFGAYVPSLGSKAPVGGISQSSRSSFLSSVFSPNNLEPHVSLTSTVPAQITPTKLNHEDTQPLPEPVPPMSNQALPSPSAEPVPNSSVRPIPKLFAQSSETVASASPPTVFSKNPTNFMAIPTAELETVFDKFAEKICQQLKSLTGKDDNLKLVTTELSNLLTGLNQLTAVQRDVQKHKLAEKEQQISKLETTVQQLTARLEAQEKRMITQNDEISQLKTDLHFRLEQHVREEETKRLERERQLKESLKVQRTAETPQQVAGILTQQLEWLERQKTKLEKQRKSNDNLRSQIGNRFQQLTQLSDQVEGLVKTISSQSRLLGDSIRKMDQRILKLSKQPPVHPPSQVTEDQNQTVGLALWKMHINNDEKQLEAQNRFLTELFSKHQ